MLSTAKCRKAGQSFGGPKCFYDMMKHMPPQKDVEKRKDVTAHLSFFLPVVYGLQFVLGRQMFEPVILIFLFVMKFRMNREAVGHSLVSLVFC